MLDAIFAPFAYPLDPSRRIFWLFLLSALVMAAICVAIQQGRFNFAVQLKSLFDRRYWLHRSSLTDIGFLFLNNAIRILILVPLLGSHLAMTMLVAGILQSGFGDAPSVQLSWLTLGLLYSGIFFLCEDISRFGLHYALHRYPLLWRFHKVHHSAEVLTPLTVHRVHPVELGLSYLRGLLVFGLVSGVFVYFFRGQVHGFDILGVDLLGFLFNFFGANLRHSPIWLSFGRLEKIFISPAQHQIHHGNLPQLAHRNFGTCLALWDQWAGTWKPAARRRSFNFGLP